MTANPKLYMAPLRGFTERPFREAFSNHFSGIDVVLAPFIPLVEVAYINPSRLKDLLPPNEKLPVIPQVIGNSAEQIIQMAQELARRGFQEVNWNLGCPMPRITRKNRGSALLQHPRELHHILTAIFARIEVKFSIKTRLGFHDKSLLPELMTLFSQFPLASLTVHARIGEQRYSGETDPHALRPFLPKFEHTPLIYNGDIVTPQDYSNLKELMPSVSSWMLGRGLITNPFLGEWIKSGNRKWETQRFMAFYTDLNRRIEESSDSAQIHLNRMKGYWTLFRLVYEDQKQIKENIFQSRNKESLLHNATKLILHGTRTAPYR
ncbi:MAG: hypothetical protein CSA95_08710 [Bacteroidetes bacterium]|nr:MAG: hypothetical protein CSA95_08710 [Bacteroidota bacterium]